MFMKSEKMLPNLKWAIVLQQIIQSIVVTAIIAEKKNPIIALHLDPWDITSMVDLQNL